MARYFRVSKSSILTFFRCGVQWFFEYLTNLPRRTDYPRLGGGEIHQHIQLIHRTPKQPRPFYFRTLKAALGSWSHRWDRALEREKDRIILPNAEAAEKMRLHGYKCIANYWKANYQKIAPLAIEKRFKYLLPDMQNILLYGIFDQLRTPSLEFIKKNRPEIFINGQLSPEYDPVLIVDLKSEYVGKGFYKDDSLEEKIRGQFKMNVSLEPVIYTYLYNQTMGKRPVGFVYYYLSNNNYIFVRCDDQDYQMMLYIIKIFIEGVRSESFTKAAGSHCRYCDYLEACSERSNLYYSEPTDFSLVSDEQIIQSFSSPVIQPQARQLKFKFKVPRSPKKLPKLRPKSSKIILPDPLPWRN
jgi:hypothetical protein